MRARFDDKIVFAIIDLVELGGVLVLVVTGRLYVVFVGDAWRFLLEHVYSRGREIKLFFLFGFRH